MHIRVLRSFSGRITHERWIAPGVYALDDPRLFGAGTYLLDTEQAEAVEVDASVNAPPPVQAALNPAPLPPARTVQRRKPKAARK